MSLKKIAIFLVAGVCLVGTGFLANFWGSRTENETMKNTTESPANAAQIPPIDAEVPGRIETATFALG